MTPPRFIFPDDTVFVTAKAVGGTFRFLPKRGMRKLVLYCLAVTLAKPKFLGQILLHEFLFMSNHYHLLLTDVGGILPDFMRDLNSLLSRCINAHYGTYGTVIEKGYNIVRVTDDEKLLEHAMYILANPCAENLVERSRDWEGASSLQMEYGEGLRVERPERGLWRHLDAPDGKVRGHGRTAMEPNRARRRHRSVLPDVVELVLTRPQARLGLSAGGLRAHIRERLEARELQLIDARRRAGIRVMGMARVRKQSWLQMPRRKRDMFGAEPHVSGKSRRAREEAQEERRKRIVAYAAARDAFVRGDRDAVFPYGTWLMVRRFGARCATAPPG